MTKTYKFEEATFKDDNGIIIEESICLNKLIELSEKDPVSFAKVYKGHLYCPDCHKVQLSFVSNKYLRGYPDQSHDLSCHYYSKPISSSPTEIAYKPYEDTAENRKRIRNNLQALINELSTENLQNAHSGSTKKRTNQSSNTSVSKQVVKAKKFTLKYPKRKLSSPINEKDLGKFMLFYGKVDVKFDTRKNKEKGTTFYSMSVFLQKTNKILFSTSMNEDVFSHVSKNTHYAFKLDNGQRYAVLIAIATILEKNKEFINSTIYHSDCLNVIEQ